MKVLKRLSIFFFILLVVSCQDYIIYHSYHHIPNQEWGKSDTLSFDIKVTDTLKYYQAFILVRNQRHYPYKNLAISVQHNFPDTTIWKTDTIQFNIADDDGNLQGVGIGGLYESIALLVDTHKIYKTTYNFNIKSIMKCDTVRGINDIGILIK